MKLPLLKNHVMVLASQVQAASSTHGPTTFIVNCNCSTKQEVIYHCEDHDDVFCNTCKDMKHYKYKVSHIQDKGSGYKTSKLNFVMSKLKALENDYAQLKKTRDTQRNSFGCSKEDCIKEINEFRKELNVFLNDLEKSTLELLDSQVDEGQKRISQHISTLQATEKMLETDDIILQDAKSNGEPCTMFAADVQVSRNRILRTMKKDIANDVINTNLKFETSIKLANLQSEIDYLGSFMEGRTTNLHTGRKILSDKTIKSTKQLNIKWFDDKNIPHITGSGVMPNGDIVMCDWGNSKLKVLESCDAQLDSLKLNAKPFDVAFVDATTVIVTCPLKEQLQYVDVYPRLKSGRVMQLNKKCWGVHLTGDNIFTTCHNNPGQAEVKILDLDGNLLRKLGANQDGSSMFITPSYIAISQSEKKVFISDIDGISVTCLTVDDG